MLVPSGETTATSASRPVNDIPQASGSSKSTTGVPETASSWSSTVASTPRAVAQFQAADHRPLLCVRAVTDHLMQKGNRCPDAGLSQMS